MIRPVNKLDNYKYVISDIILSAPDFTEPITIPPIQTSSLTIIRSYEKNMTPLMLLSAQVKKDEYEKVVTSMSKLTATFTLYKSPETGDNKKTISYNMPYIQGTFKVSNKDVVDTKVSGQIQNSTTNTSNSTQATVGLNLYLYDSESIIKYKKNFSYIQNSTANDCLFTMLKDRGFKNILMSTASTKTENFIIPYGSLQDNLSFMDEYYGIYDNPRLFFIDFDTTYLLDKGKVGKTLRKDELSSVMMYLEKSQDESSSHDGCYVDVENGTYILNAGQFSINDTDSIADFYSAGKIISLVSGTSTRYEEVIGDYPVEKAVIVNNPKSHSQSMFEINDSKRGIVIEFADIDMNIITPNKRYSLIPDSSYDSNYHIKGNYRLTQSIMVFTSQTEDIMKSVVQCTFTKLNK